jgi:pimeloyl-ACP methyl ester carboxylesterase
LKKLILVCGAASGEFIEEAKKHLAEIGTPAQKKMGTALLNGTFDFSSGYYDTMGPTYSLLFQPGMPTPNIAFNAELFNLGFSKFLREFDYRPELSKIKCQTLIISGEGDWICDTNQAKTLHHGIPGSKLLIYQDCKHMIWIDQRKRFLHDIIDFLTH